jgi:hypothetical protein
LVIPAKFEKTKCQEDLATIEAGASALVEVGRLHAQRSKKKKTIKDYYFYVDNTKQASNYETTAELW